jgi:DNA-binding transcriptional regulator LsrR (DeoR family)
MKENVIDNKILIKYLDDIKSLLQQLVIINLYQTGATQDEITKNMKIRKATINQMLRGVKRDKS